MSYCVNCGVELAESEKHCPLCNTEVINPNNPWTKPERTLYPAQREVLPKPAFLRYIALLSVIMLSVPILVTLVIDLLVTGTITWSLFVLGACVLVFVIVFFPMLFAKYNIWIFIPTDFLAVFLYLFMVSSLIGKTWGITIALPVCIATCSFTLLIVSLFMYKKTTLCMRAAILFFALGVYVMLIELIISDHHAMPFTLVWSYYVLIPCAAIAIAFVVINSQKKLKEELKKRMFLQ